MAASDGSTDTRIRQLASDVRALTDRLDLLSRRVEALAASGAGARAAEPDTGVVPGMPGEAHHVTELSTILSTAATVSFLLVVALVLRTIVDNGIVDRAVGTWVGIVYAGLIVALGHARYAAGAARAPVYSTCGALLLLALVAESHARFETLSAAAAYGVLVAAMAALSATGFRFSSAAPLVAGTLGASMVALGLDFPRPAFVVVALLVLLSNVIAFAARGIAGCGWLRWASFAVSMGFWSLWNAQLRAPLLRHEALPAHAAAEWFLPAVASFALCYLLLALWSFLRAGRTLGWFAPFLVVANVVWAYGSAATLAGPWLGAERALAATAAALAVGHALGAWVFARARLQSSAAVVSLTWAGLLLLGFSLTGLPPGHDWAVVIWSAVATGLGVAAARTDVDALRATSCLYQAFALAAAVVLGVLSAASAEPLGRGAALLALGALCTAHYYVCRRGLAACEAARLTLLPGDRLGVTPLLAGLIYLFAGARVALHASLAPQRAADFQSAQSILINLMAVGLLAIGCARRDGELFVVALTVGALGAARVFGYDLLTIQGLPLVCSVLSFGLATAVASLLWRRWQRAAAPGPAAPDPGAAPEEPPASTRPVPG
jgi:hypothetical protein